MQEIYGRSFMGSKLGKNVIVKIRVCLNEWVNPGVIIGNNIMVYTSSFTNSDLRDG